MRDFFFDRLMFPIADGRGRIIAFGGRGLEADAKPKYINSGENTLFSKGSNLYNFATARAAAIKAGTIILAEGYMDVIALVRGGFAHAVAPLGTALTDDQLQLLWRTAPEPILAFDGDAAGLKAAHRAAHLALPHLKAGYSLALCLSAGGRGSRHSLIAKSGAARDGEIAGCGAAFVGSAVAGRNRGQGFFHPRTPRRAGAGALRDIVGQITDGKIADYYRRDFEQKIFDSFKRRPQAAPSRPAATSRPGQGLPRTAPAPAYGTRRSGLRRRESQPFGPGRPGRPGPGGRPGPVKEAELATLLLDQPALALPHGELLAELPFQRPIA